MILLKRVLLTDFFLFRKRPVIGSVKVNTQINSFQRNIIYINSNVFLNIQILLIKILLNALYSSKFTQKCIQIIYADDNTVLCNLTKAWQCRIIFGYFVLRILKFMKLCACVFWL